MINKRSIKISRSSHIFCNVCLSHLSMICSRDACERSNASMKWSSRHETFTLQWLDASFSVIHSVITLTQHWPRNSTEDLPCDDARALGTVTRQWSKKCSPCDDCYPRTVRLPGDDPFRATSVLQLIWVDCTRHDHPIKLPCHDHAPWHFDRELFTLQRSCALAWRAPIWVNTQKFVAAVTHTKLIRDCIADWCNLHGGRERCCWFVNVDVLIGQFSLSPKLSVSTRRSQTGLAGDQALWGEGGGPWESPPKPDKPWSGEHSMGGGTNLVDIGLTLSGS